MILSTILQEYCKETKFDRACLSLSYSQQKKSSLFKSENYFFVGFLFSFFLVFTKGSIESNLNLPSRFASVCVTMAMSNRWLS